MELLHHLKDSECNYKTEMNMMKSYIVLDPISNTDPQSFFAKTRTFNREVIVTQLYQQTYAKVFIDEHQAFHHARSFSKKARPPKASGRIAPIIRCEEFEIPSNCELKEEFCLTHDADPDVTKTNMVGLFIQYFLVPTNIIAEDALLQCFFPKESFPTVNLRRQFLSCQIL